MVDRKLLIDTVAEFARGMSKLDGIEQVLAELAGHARAVAAVSGAAVAVQDTPNRSFVASVDDVSTRLERFQVDTRSGPCIDAMREGRPVTVFDLAADGGRWPRFRAVASEVGVRAVAAVPMSSEGRTIGSVDLYHTAPVDWQDVALDAVTILADLGSCYVLHALELAKQRDVTEQLRQALASRIVIEQAKGIIAAERGIGVEAAFQLLREHARKHNANLHELAGAVVTLGLRI